MSRADDDPKDQRGDKPARKRRPRYSGTHPQRFEEKYKELEPERFPAAVQKVRERGQTPAGTHVPVMLEEVLEVLAPAPGQFGLDCTLGYGGHAEAIARRLLPGGKLIALDRDPEELQRTKERLIPLHLPIAIVPMNFAGAAHALAERQIAAVDFALADLGVSSMQLDRPERGFSWKRPGPLDLRMDPSRGKPAWEWLADAEESAIADVIREHGEDPDADQIAAGVLERRRLGPPITTTRDLKDVVLRAKGLDPRQASRQASAFDAHPAARTFQALRIVVNQELEALDALLRDLPYLLKSGGRAAFLAFHSGEARRIRAAFHAGVEQGLYQPGAGDARAPSKAEVYDNPRARSARLYVAVRA